MNKNRLLVSIVAGFLALIMLLSLVVSLIPVRASAESSSEIQSQIDSLQDEQAEIESQIADLNAKKEANYEEIKGIVAEKNIIEQQINLLYKQKANINEQIAAMNTKIADKQEELDAAQQRYDELKQKNKARIRAMEEGGGLSYWAVLFKANSFTDFLDRLNMIQEIAAADRRHMKELADAAKELEDAKKTMEQDKAALEKTKESLIENEKALDEKKAEIQEIMDMLLEREAEYLAEMRECEEAKAALIDEIGAKELEYAAALEAEWQEYLSTMTTAAPSGGGESSGEGSGEGSGSAPWTPSSGEGWLTPCYYTVVTDSYGWRIHPFGGYESFHSGVDLAANEGTPIYATRSGYVTTSTYHWSFGNYVTINHGDGYSSMYAHMMYAVVESGEYVSQGQLIGYMGETGEATGPHLHFVIYYNGSTVNPFDYI